TWCTRWTRPARRHPAGPSSPAAGSSPRRQSAGSATDRWSRCRRAEAACGYGARASAPMPASRRRAGTTRPTGGSSCPDAARSGVAVHLAAAPDRVEERQVERLHRVPLRVRRARFEPERLDDARMLVVARVGEEQERRQEELIARGERPEQLAALVPGERRPAVRMPAGRLVGDRRQAVLDEGPEHRRLLHRARDVADWGGC